jgi:hypothetical protein
VSDADDGGGFSTAEGTELMGQRGLGFASVFEIEQHPVETGQGGEFGNHG